MKTSEILVLASKAVNSGLGDVDVQIKLALHPVRGLFLEEEKMPVKKKKEVKSALRKRKKK